jgi:PAS domain S-box-containing protein
MKESNLVIDEAAFDLPRLCRYFSELSPQPMLAVEGANHVVRHLNGAFSRLAGKNAAELIGRPFAEAVPEGDANGCLVLLDRVFRTGTAETLMEQAHRQTPTTFWSYSMWAILGSDERPVGVMVQVSDATEVTTFREQSTAMNESLLLSSLKQHELTETAEKLNDALTERTQALADEHRRKDEFLAMLAHELRNPLAAIVNSVYLLALEKNETSNQQSARTIIARQLGQLTRLIDDLMEISRISSGRVRLRPERVVLSGILDHAADTARPLIEQRRHTLEVSLPARQIWLVADAPPAGADRR